MTITCNLYINGQWHDAEGRRTFTRRHPAHDEAASVAAAASLADGKRCVEAAACAFPLWRDTAPAERRRLLLEAAEQMLLREAKFIAAMAAETGATAHWAGFNVHLAADILREAAALTTQIEGQIIPSNVPGNLAMGVRQGAGVVLGMAPWNAPLILATRALATPLACGNTVILKGAELSPATQGLIIDALDAAGFPPGVVNYLTCAPEDAPALVESLIAHPAVRRVNFTGSTPVGRIIARTCGQYLKPAVLELGGKAPLLVLDDADIEQAAAGAVFWRLRQRRADLHVHRAHYCRQCRSGGVYPAAGQARRRPACRPHGPGCRYEHHRPLQRAHRRCVSERRSPADRW
ncbi:4-aminobutyraldehyde dehydrogenase [Klebsiella pneumoniae]|nr:4-aminobutyraldehyde dehydrogenase [Klebsiella pneumoniae]